MSKKEIGVSETPSNKTPKYPLERRQKLIDEFKSKNTKPLQIKKGESLFSDLGISINPDIKDLYEQGYSVSDIIGGHNSAIEIGTKIYVVISTYGCCREFCRVESVFLTRKEAENYIKPREESLSYDDISLKICESYLE